VKKYLITSPEFYTDIPEIFTQKLEKQIEKHKPDFVLLRHKETSHYHVLAVAFMQVMEKYPAIKAFIHDDIKLAVELKVAGVHLPSNSFDKIEKAKREKLEVIVSTHNQDEVVTVERLGADYVTYSPIFTTPNKGEPKGVEALSILLAFSDIHVFALGGIVTDKEVALLCKTKVYGFASIRYFY